MALTTMLVISVQTVFNKCFTSCADVSSAIYYYTSSIYKKKVLANYNKTKRINIGHQHDRWVKLKVALKVQTHAEV
jgi:hypothetical protein